jgi:hypothetical protein
VAAGGAERRGRRGLWPRGGAVHVATPARNSHILRWDTPPPLPLAPSHAALNAFTMYIFTYTSVINAGNFKAEWAKR